MKWLSLLAAAAVIAACFCPWITVASAHYTVGGFHSDNDNFGKPGIVHVILCGLFLFLVAMDRIWSLRTAFLVSAFNIAWALRNFILISACRGGTCPDKHPALYVVLTGSILMMAFLLFTGGPAGKITTAPAEKPAE